MVIKLKPINSFEIRLITNNHGTYDVLRTIHGNKILAYGIRKKLLKDPRYMNKNLVVHPVDNKLH